MSSLDSLTATGWEPPTGHMRMDVYGVSADGERYPIRPRSGPSDGPCAADKPVPGCHCGGSVTQGGTP